MKKKYSLTKSIGKKNTILALVALVLVMMTVVGASFSWIEEVSQVEFNSNNGQETPLHVGSKVLKADVNMKENPTTDTIDLNEYFYKSGDMHLSPCYGDGESFYFPVTSSSSTSDKFRVGTKDDANVNYLSATFRVKSEAANTGYWFEKSGTTDFITFKNSSGSAITGADLTNLKRLLRVSVTVDGNTNVYAYNTDNTDGAYKTLESSSDTSATSKDGRRIDKYMYYTESFNNSSPVNYYKNSANVTDKPNQGATDGNLNGNTLFTVNKYDSSKKTGVKEVTVKLWLEYNASYCVEDVKVSNVNLNIVSSWNKTRRIYVQDKTIKQAERTQAKWLTHNGTSDNQAGLYWALKEDTTKHWEMTRVSSTSAFYYVDIPAVYNNVAATLYRKQYKNNFDSTTWDSWETVFPNTFHSETYTVYTSDFGTWDDSDVHSVYFVNSAFFDDVYDYMWDSNSIHGSGINDKVVKNADWPGKEMKTKTATKTSSQSLDAYAFYYNSDYDRIIFNDGDLVVGKNQEYQTQDLWLTDNNGNELSLLKNGTFDMATLTWFGTNPTKSDWSTKMPTYSASNTYLYGNFSTNNAWKKTRFAYGGQYSSTSGDAFNGTNANNMLAKVYIKASGDYEFIIYYNGNIYKTYPQNVNLYPGGNLTVYREGGNNTANVYAKNLQGGHVYRFYIQPNGDGYRIDLVEGEATAGY